MSDFMAALVDLLPEHNSLKKRNNELFNVLDKSVGEWFDNHNIQDIYDALFLNTATGKYLDLHGKDFGVIRKAGESDEDYKNRLIISSLKHLTPKYLKTLYDLDLYVSVLAFSISNNDLTSNNPYINQYGYMAENTNGIMDIINNKFILDANFLWITSDDVNNYIIDVNDYNILPQYREIYTLKNINSYFYYNLNIKEVKLYLPNVTTSYNVFSNNYNLEKASIDLPHTTDASAMFGACNHLTEVDLNLPIATNIHALFLWCAKLTSINLDFPLASNCNSLVEGCDELESVTLSLPSLTSYQWIFDDCPKLKTINLTIPSSIVNDMISYIESLELQYLESLIINGEEVDLT